METSQAIKAISTILSELNSETTICYSKAENVSAFRQNFGKIKEGNRKSENNEKLIKVREINDYHHAKDAYLNIVVGNVYDVKFTRNVYNFIKNKKDARKYSLNSLFYTDVKNANTIAWEMDKTVHVVEKTMNNNNILITRRTAEQKGALYDATVYKAKIAEKAKEGTYYPLKTTDNKIQDVNKYGGFTKVKIAYYSIFEYTIEDRRGESRITRIVPIPIYISQNIKDDKALLEYAKTQLSGKDLKLKYRKLCIGNLIKINNFNYYMGGKTSDNFTYDSAIQVVLDKDSEVYIKELAKYLNWKKENKNGEIWNNITKNKNIQLYNALVEKMNTGIFIRKKPNKYDELTTEEVRDKFKNISRDEQAKVLLEILNLLTNKKSTFDLQNIDIKTSRGKCGFNLSNQSQFSIIEQSVTGVYEKEIVIVGEKIMTWRTVVIRERAKLDYSLNFMTVRQEEGVRKISLGEIYMVIVENTAVSLTAVLLNELVKNKIKVVFCDEKRNPSSELIQYYGSHDTSLKYKNQLEWSKENKEKIWTRIVYEKFLTKCNF